MKLNKLCKPFLWAALLLGIYLITSYVDFHEHIHVFFNKYEHINIDELCFSFFIFIVVLLFYIRGNSRALVKEINAREKAERRYRSLFENNQSLMLIVDPEMGELVDANSAACSFYGIEEKSLSELNISDFSTLPKKELKREWQLAKSQGHYFFDKRIIANGDVREVEVYSGPIELNGRKLIYSITHDITERIRAEEALRESEEKYRSIMAAMNDMVYICSVDRRIEYMNPAMIRRTGYDATGELCYKALHGRDEMCPWCANEIVQEGREHRLEVVSPKDSSCFQVFNTPLCHDDGSISKMAVMRDITESKMAEKEKERLESRLHQAQRIESIGTLAGGIAHDFNNILSPIMGYTELTIQRLPENSREKKNLLNILKAADRAKELVQQILTFSRQSEYKKLSIEVQVVAAEVLTFLRASIPATIEIRQKTDKPCGPVLADPVQIHQVIMNLCTNAYHATEERGGFIAVDVTEVTIEPDDRRHFPDLNPGGYVLLSVSDTGHGMELGIIEKIFDPYFTTKQQGKGTGMGLATVHGIVKSCGGNIRVDSEPDKGTTFYVYLPKIDNLADVSPGIVSTTQTRTGTERILLVDDEVAIVQMEKERLEGLGYHVTGRTSSVEALEAFRNSPDRFDLVITDMMMPNMGGMELSWELKQLRPNIPIILCSGFSEKLSRERINMIGIDAILMKPIPIKELSVTIRNVILTQRPTSDNM